MGLARAYIRSRAPEPAHNRAITEFAIVDGQRVFGSEAGSGSYRGAMRIPGAWRGATLISDLLGQVPWHAYRQHGRDRQEQLNPTPPLLERPNPEETRMDTISAWGLDLLWNGNAVGLIASRDSHGVPAAVLPVSAARVSVRRAREHRRFPAGTILYAVGDREYPAWDVLHVKGPHEPGDLRGMGVMEYHLVDGALGLAQEQMRQSQGIANAGVPTGYLQNENEMVTQAEVAAQKAAWLTSQRDRTIAVLNKNLTFQPLAWNPEQMQMIEARRYSLTDIELIFGLPVGWLGGMNSARQYSNIEQDAVNLLKFTLGGHLARFEQALSNMLPRGTTVRADLDSILRSDTLTRYQAHEIAVKNRWMTPDEVRDVERMPPLPPGAFPEPTTPPTEIDPEEEA